MNSQLGGNNSFIILFTFLFFLGCQPDNLVEDTTTPDRSYAGVDERLWEYFDRFEVEGKARGYSIDIRSQRITGEIREIEEEHVAGICSYNFRAPNHITIDEEFWFEAPRDLWREMIIFHELGHCYLNQDHREGVLARHICASIMRSGNEGCFDNYTSQSRSYYLDELFDFDSSGN